MMILAHLIDEMRLELTPEQVRLIQEHATEICYDRQRCRQLGVDYNTLPEADVRKIYKFVIEEHLSQKAA